MSTRNRKVGRNDKCPCGSGKKFKHCHRGIHEPKRPHIGQADNRLSKLNQKPQCLAPSSMKHECKGKIIDSHSVSRSGSLVTISKDGHVYSIKPTLIDIEKNKGEIHPKLLRAKIASTFPGFCAYHDKTIFSKIEDKPFTGSHEQCFLLGYRSISRDLYAVQCVIRHAAYRKTMAINLTENIKTFVDRRNNADRIRLRDLERHKEKYDKILETKNWRECSGILIEFEGTFPIQCSAAYSPLHDINNEEIQKLDTPSITPEIVTINSFSANQKSYFLLSWLRRNSNAPEKLAKSITLLDKERIPGVIGAYILLISENSHMSPDWYDNIPSSGKNLAINLINNYYYPKPSACSVSMESYMSDIKISSISMIS